DIAKMVALILATWGLGKIVYDFYMNYDPNIILFGLSLIVLTIVYIILLFILKFISKDELEQIPFLQKWIREYLFCSTKGFGYSFTGKSQAHELEEFINP